MNTNNTQDRTEKEMKEQETEILVDDAIEAQYHSHMERGFGGR